MKRLPLCFQRVCSVCASSVVGALSLLALALVVQTGSAAAKALPTTPPVNLMGRLMEQFVLDRTAGLPGKVAVRFDKAMLQGLPACVVPELFLPAGARLWGRVSVGVRCNAAQPWVRYVSAYVSVIGVHYVAVQPITAGQTLSLADVEVREGDLTALPASVLVDAAQVDGMVASNRIAAGAPLRRELLRAPVIVQRGQNVKVMSQGAGFMVSTEGRAMTQAAAGALLQVKTRGGGVISGIVRPDGTVEQSP
ncbi:MAG: flagellar basal body P-ring formation protein FlgA [Comamonadaceae bacterium CG_4_9_14_3_um_filter_60_33]|nr:MAG: flagella basal body P-ring formation protein FlgA [Comamonadaceae bacterium CG2_30_59_20]PIY29152.1 MAG: flagellar basal body P-ring formation protein FlgA [Comamonadaceae bacterium CG_4_10_14_3_um_filter_60_42]PJB43626.1 MAG: flagellar basal body P-ring formation protein FlgA [Comamonadaceae bacterium CG_4_9_14_3_um_filter_60_33]